MLEIKTLSPTLTKSLNDKHYVIGVSSYDYDRYVGAQIGIHDLEGNKVGEVSHLKNKEHIFICEVTK